jgi:hypothetical protein
MKGILALLSGIGLGAALMYLFDPEGGNRRRALIRDKAVSLNNKTQRAVSGRVQDMSNRAKGVLHETRSVLSGGSEETAEGAHIQ